MSLTRRGLRSELVRRAVELGVELREQTAAEGLERDLLVLACGARSADVAARLGVELPIRPLVRQLLETGALDVPERLPMIVEAESGFHFRSRGDRLVLAMTDAEPRWGWDESVDESVYDDRLARLAHRFPPAAAARVEEAWAGLYDMTPDAHPIVGLVADGVYAACGFSGHGFMQAPAVGEAVAQELLEGGSRSTSPRTGSSASPAGRCSRRRSSSEERRYWRRTVSSRRSKASAGSSG